MIGAMDCVYKTPCGWCSRLDKQCDRGRGMKCKPKEILQPQTKENPANMVSTIPFIKNEKHKESNK